MSNSSDDLESAVAYLSNSPALSKVSNDVKLEIYALYKCITVSKNPQTPRPSLFDFTGRAKWDAWDKLGRQSDQPEPSAWRKRYLSIARSLGWQEGVQSDSEATGGAPASASDEETRTRDAQSGRGGGSGMGVVVSAMSQPLLDDHDHGTLHGFALSNDAKGLLEFLNAHSEINLDSLDDYGYTALHLAADRGSESVVKILLDKGADASLKDSDETTALELAEIGGRDDIREMLQRHAIS